MLIFGRENGDFASQNTNRHLKNFEIFEDSEFL